MATPPLRTTMRTPPRTTRTRTMSRQKTVSRPARRVARSKACSCHLRMMNLLTGPPRFRNRACP
eukprot:573269-Prymnesium_polylepis.1